MQALVVETERAWQSLGRVSYGATRAEQASLQFRRSLYASQDIAAGEALTPANVRAIRPGMGLMPKHLETVLKRKAKVAIKRGTALNWDLLD